MVAELSGFRAPRTRDWTRSDPALVCQQQAVPEKDEGRSGWNNQPDRPPDPSLPNGASYLLDGYRIFRLATATIASSAEPIQNRTTILIS